MSSASKNRRTFLKHAIVGLSSFALARRLPASTLQANSRVIIVDDPASISGLTPNPTVVQAMVNAGIRSLAQAADMNQAWQQLLPGVTAASRIAIKVNCINSSLSTHPAVALAVASSLKQMNFSGTPFPENNIIIFDRTGGELQSAGYGINTSTTGVRCFGTDRSGVGYSTTTYSVAGQSQRISKIVTEMSDFLINVAVLKNHGDGGVTLCMKNHYGTCTSPGNMHGGNCNPYVPALNSLDPIKTKQKVFIIDALAGIIAGGPSGPPSIFPKKLLFGTDIVAVDYQGRKLLADNGCQTTGYATHIDTAASTYALGTNNPLQMDVVSISRPTNVAAEQQGIPGEIRLEANYPNPFNPVTNIGFHLPVRPAGGSGGEAGSAAYKSVKLTVYDLLGREVAVLANGPMESGSHTARFDGSLLPSGVYLCRLHAGDVQQTIRMVLAK
jgi:uncharacterized protein (DUF362 family)